MSEIPQEFRTELNRRYNNAVIVVLVQIVLAVILAAAGWYYAGTAENSASQSALFSLRIIFVLAAATAIVLRRFLFRWDRISKTAMRKGISGVLILLQSNAVVLGGIAEIVAIIGFLLAALSGIRTEMLTFGAIALLLFWMLFPRRQIWERVAANLVQVQGNLNERN